MKGRKVLLFMLSMALTGGTFTALPNTVSASSEIQREIYVSLLGNDENSGTEEAPFKTIKRARDEVRAINSNMSGDIYINIAAGEYFMDETLDLNEQDSGTNGFKIIYQGIADGDGNKPVISGGVDISKGWEIYDESKSIYKHENIDWEFRQLYTNNDRAIRARVPNLLNKETGGPYLRATDGDGAYPLFIGKNSKYAQASGDKKEVIWNSSWSQFRARIEDYDANTGRLTFKTPDSTFAWNHHTQGNTPYFLENSLDYLDADGEWYLDTDTKTLYYKPRTGEIMNETQIIAPRLETIVNIEGTDNDSKVKNISINGLRFLHSNWLAPNDYGYCSVQGGFRYQSEGGSNNSAIRGSARYDAPKSMIQLKYTDGIALTDSEFSFSGSWGIMGYEGTSNTLIDHNRFIKNAGGGVTMGMAGREWDDQTEDEKPRVYTDMDGQSVGDTITNNYIDHVACDYKDMVGIGAMLPQHMTIANNEIGYLPYTGINIGWNWLDTNHGMTDNKVYQNYIHDTCMLLQDGGGIYSLGRMDGDSNFYYNYITNIEMSQWAPHDNLMGIYFDNGSCYKKAQSNVFNNTVYSFQASNPPNHDNIFEGNYYNCPKGISSIGSSASILNRPFTSDAIPTEAQNIIDHAGIDKEKLPSPSSQANLAFGKNVVSSENDDISPASNATDGDSSTLWEQRVDNRPDSSKAETSLTIDLEDSYSIDGIAIKFQYGNRCKYKIEYSDDNSTWNEYVNKLSRAASPSESVYEAKSGVRARYIKLTMNTDGWGAGVYEIAVYSNETNIPASARLSETEVTYDKNPMRSQNISFEAFVNGCAMTALKNGGNELKANKDYEKHWNSITLLTSYLDTLPAGENEITIEFDKCESKTLVITVEEDDGAINLALNKPITATSYNTDEANRAAEFAVDGDTSTRWAQKGNTAGTHNFLNIDLGRECDIKSVNIHFELSGGYNYKIEYSSDGINYQTYVNKLSEQTNTQIVSDVKKVNARYFRFEVNNDQWGASIYEIEIFGVNADTESKWTVIEAKPRSGKIIFGEDNTFEISVRENVEVQNGIIYAAVYKRDGSLYSVDMKKNVVFDENNINIDMYTLKIPSDESCTLKVFAWEDSQCPLDSCVYTLTFVNSK